MLFDLSGKVAVITGSSRGIGRAIAERMAEAGAKVVVSSRKAESCRPVVEAITARGGTALNIPCHIGHGEQIDNLVAKTVEAWGKIDILVCNAAANPYFGPLGKISEEAFDKTIRTNVHCNLWLCNRVAPGMAERKDGAIIVISSLAGFMGTGSLGAYAISKHADLGLVRSLAVELGPSNIRVNAITPGVIKTDFARALWDNPRIYQATVGVTPLGRIGEVDEVAGAAVFLASKAGGYITGATLVIDGGRSINAGT